MSKNLRNLVFTIVALVLTGVGLAWNEQVAREHNRVNAGELALASNTAFIADQSDFPLNVEISRSIVKLGQVQLLSLLTNPFADLEITVVKPNGQIDRQFSTNTHADEVGRYQHRMQLDDFRSTGQFQVLVTAKLPGQVSERALTFTVEPWSQPVTDDYVYPLVP